MHALVNEMTLREWQEMDPAGRAHLGADGEPLVRISPDDRVQLAYERMRHKGVSHNLAEMFALQHPPQLAGTDAIFNEGRCNGNQFEGAEWLGDAYRRQAAEAGVDVKGKTYLGGLAAFPGDPRAWVSDLGDVKKVCEERGWGCRGAVSVKAPEPAAPPKPGPAVAPDIVEAKVAEIVETRVAAVDRGRVDVQDLREQVKDRLKPHWSE